MSLSGDTPFASGEIAESIGMDGRGEAVEALLEGTFDWGHREGTSLEDSKEMLIFLQKLQRPTLMNGKKLPEMNGEMTLADYYDLFNNTKESTSSHPPVHYGHYKVACESEVLAKVNLAFMNLPF